jgi:hypothetical protein
VAVAADADTLAVVSGYDNRRVFQIAFALAPAQKLLDNRVRRFDVLQVFAVVAAARVAGLIDTDELDHQQIGIILTKHLFGEVRQSVIDLFVVHDGRYCANVFFSERVDKVSDADKFRL